MGDKGLQPEGKMEGEAHKLADDGKDAGRDAKKALQRETDKTARDWERPDR